MPPPALPFTAAAARRLASQSLCARQSLRLATTDRTALFSSTSTQRACGRRFRPAPPGPATSCLPYIPAFSPASGRWFHSFDHPNEPPAQDNFGAAEQAILSAAVRHIPTEGFTGRTIGLGAYDAGYPGISTTILPDGVFSLVRWHLVSQRTNLAVRSREILGDTLSEGVTLAPAEVADRAERLIWERLLGNKDVVGRWQEVRCKTTPPMVHA